MVGSGLLYIGKMAVSVSYTVDRYLQFLKDVQGDLLFIEPFNLVIESKQSVQTSPSFVLKMTVHVGNTVLNVKHV
jgi:hypothetical protein